MVMTATEGHTFLWCLPARAYQILCRKQPVKKAIKIGRNDPCPCGSGLKWKKCTCAQYHSQAQQ